MSTVRYQDSKIICRVWEEGKLLSIFWVVRLDVQVTREIVVDEGLYTKNPIGVAYYDAIPNCTFRIETEADVTYDLPFGPETHQVYITFQDGREHRMRRGHLIASQWEVNALGYGRTQMEYMFRRDPGYITKDGSLDVYGNASLSDIPLFPFYRSILIPFGSDFTILKKFETDLLFGNQNEEEKETIRGIYVDWLGDNGDHEYAELVREHGLSFEKLVQLSKETAVHV